MLTTTKKPQWLNKKINLADCAEMQNLLSDLSLHTVCRQASCPNIGECFKRGEATFLILGEVCTRACAFCNVTKGMTSTVDLNEPLRIAEAVRRMRLKHVVITSVTRDDLPDGGAVHFAKTIEAIRSANLKVTIEVLIPDFQLNHKALQIVSQAHPDIIGHNVETVPRLYPVVRQGSFYERSLEVLRILKEFDTLIYSKSGLMLGMGESEEEVLAVCADLRAQRCDFLSIGQYLSPSAKHYKVQEYIPQERFDYYRQRALEMGFSFVASGPYVRSSYLAAEYLKRTSS